MAPLIAGLLTTLAQNGLGMLASAIQAKGKEVIEEKIGVKIPDDPAKVSPELLQQLQIKQMEHEEFLVQAGIEKQKLELEEAKAYLGDTQSARQRDIAMIQAGYQNSRANRMLMWAGIAVFVILFIVIMKSPLDEFVKGVLTLVLGRALGYLDQGYNFEFGTTRSSGKKDAIIDKLSGRG